MRELLLFQILDFYFLEPVSPRGFPLNAYQEPQLLFPLLSIADCLRIDLCLKGFYLLKKVEKPDWMNSQQKVEPSSCTSPPINSSKHFHSSSRFVEEIAHALFQEKSPNSTRKL